jgi:hypothetical protein
VGTSGSTDWGSRDVLGGQGVRIHDRLRGEIADDVAVPRQVLAIGAEVSHGNPRFRLMAAPMDHHHVVPAIMQPLDDASSDKSRSAQHQYAHGPILPHADRRPSRVGRNSVQIQLITP